VRAKDTVAYSKRPALSLGLYNTDFGDRDAFRFPMFGNSNRLVAINADDFENRNLGNAAHLMKCATGSHVDQPLIGHIFQQCLERYLLNPPQPEFTRNFALSGGFIGRLDKLENLFAVRETNRVFFCHVAPRQFWFARRHEDTEDGRSFNKRFIPSLNSGVPKLTTNPCVKLVRRR
jgi:hypothetical protein